MKAFFKKFKKGQKGFTLIELLVVVAILGVLAAVVVPNVSNFIGTADDEAMDTEKHNVQLAITAAMVDNNISTVTAGTRTNNMETDIDPGAGTVYISTYLLQTTSQYWYTWDTSGRITAQFDSAAS